MSTGLSFKFSPGLLLVFQTSFPSPPTLISVVHMCLVVDLYPES